MIHRRHFSRAVLALPFATLAPTLHAQPVEGRHYRKLPTRQPTRDPQRVEVTEFFAYSCHHCHDLEPSLEAWRKQLPPDIVLRRVPVAFREDFQIHSALYFALETLGLVDRLHGKVFEAAHGTKGGLKTPADITAFLQSQGANSTEVLNTMRSFSMGQRLKQAAEMANAYEIEGTPTLAIDGRWVTDASLAGSNKAALAVADHLANTARKRS